MGAGVERGGDAVVDHARAHDRRQPRPGPATVQDARPRAPRRPGGARAAPTRRSPGERKRIAHGSSTSRSSAGRAVSSARKSATYSAVRDGRPASTGVPQPGRRPSRMCSVPSRWRRRSDDGADDVAPRDGVGDPLVLGVGVGEHLGGVGDVGDELRDAALHLGHERDEARRRRPPPPGRCGSGRRRGGRRRSPARRP